MRHGSGRTRTQARLGAHPRPGRNRQRGDHRYDATRERRVTSELWSFAGAQRRRGRSRDLRLLGEARRLAKERGQVVRRSRWATT